MPELLYIPPHLLTTDEKGRC